MTNNDWKILDDAFAIAISLVGREREEMLAEFSAEHAELEQKLKDLLAADSDDDRMLADPVANSARELAESAVDPWVGRRIGAWTIKRRIADGGMGTVFLAERSDDEYQQDVALKIMTAQLLAKDAVTRFRAERQILASLNHPNVAQLIDGGSTDENLPYLVLELVDGLPIDEHCDSLKLDISARLQLFTKVCKAVDYAHRNLIVHRDLKPNNILVDAGGEPKLLDFGIAKLLENSSIQQTIAPTRDGMRAMTPEYASPEQVRGEPVSVVTDVYALGVLLYRLMTGQSPYGVSTTVPREYEAAVLDSEPPRPSTVVTSPEADENVGVSRAISPAKLQRRLAGDLDNIVLHALQKEPARRYASVREFSQDIENYLGHRPVMARPDSLAYRSRKFVQRRRASLLVGSGMLALVVGMSAVFINRIILERNTAEAERERAEQVTSFLTELLRGVDRFRGRGEEVTLRDVLDDGAELIETELVEQPIERAQLMEVVAETYNAISLNDKAAALSRQAMDIRLHELGERHQDTLASMRNVGHFERLAGANVEKSVELLQKTKELQIDVLGAGSHEVASTIYTLAQALRDAGDHSAALEGFEQGYDIIVNLPEEHADHRYEADYLNQIGSTHNSLGDTGKAIEYYERSLAWLESRKLSDRPLYGALLSNIGGVLRKDGRADESVEYLERAVAFTRRILGEENEDYEVQLSAYGRTLGELARFDEANEALKKARAVAGKLYGEDHQYFAWHLVNLARLRQLENRYADSITLLDRAIPIYRKAYGDYHPFLAAAEIGHSESSLELGRAAVAVNQISETLERMQQDPTRERHIEALGRGVLGRAFGELGRDEEAKTQLSAALADLREMFGDEHLLTAQVARYLVDFLDARGATAEANPYRALTARYDRFKNLTE